MVAVAERLPSRMVNEFGKSVSTVTQPTVRDCQYTDGYWSGSMLTRGVHDLCVSVLQILRAHILPLTNVAFNKSGCKWVLGALIPSIAQLSKSAKHDIWLLIYYAPTSLRSAEMGEKIFAAYENYASRQWLMSVKTNIPADDMRLFFSFDHEIYDDWYATV